MLAGIADPGSRLGDLSGPATRVRAPQTLLQPRILGGGYRTAGQPTSTRRGRERAWLAQPQSQPPHAPPRLPLGETPPGTAHSICPRRSPASPSPCPSLPLREPSAAPKVGPPQGKALRRPSCIRAGSGPQGACPSKARKADAAAGTGRAKRRQTRGRVRKTQVQVRGQELQRRLTQTQPQPRGAPPATPGFWLLVSGTETQIAVVPNHPV